jgi:hypothetical protein
MRRWPGAGHRGEQPAARFKKKKNGWAKAALNESEALPVLPGQRRGAAVYSAPAGTDRPMPREALAARREKPSAGFTRPVKLLHPPVGAHPACRGQLQLAQPRCWQLVHG